MKNASTGKIILWTALVATAVILCAVVLIAVIVFLCFPFEGYKFADNMGMDRLALRFAENYENDGHIDGLVYCIDKADKLLQDTDDLSYAKKLTIFTEKFFTYDNAESYLNQLDDYYNDDTLDIRVRVGLYSYMDHIISTNYKARTLIGDGEDNSMIHRGNVTALSEIFSSDDLTVNERSYVFSALSKQFIVGKSILVNVDAEGAMIKSEYYDEIMSIVSEQFAALVDSNLQGMDRFYVLHRLYYFLNATKEYLDGKFDADWEIFFDKNYYQVDGTSLAEAYKQLFDKLDNKGGANEK